MTIPGWIWTVLTTLAAIAAVVVAIWQGRAKKGDDGQKEKEAKIKADTEERTETRMAIKGLGEKIDETNRNIVAALGSIRDHGDKIQDLDRRVYALECTGGRKPRATVKEE